MDSPFTNKTSSNNINTLPSVNSLEETGDIAAFQTRQFHVPATTIMHDQYKIFTPNLQAHLNDSFVNTRQRVVMISNKT